MDWLHATRKHRTETDCWRVTVLICVFRFTASDEFQAVKPFQNDVKPIFCTPHRSRQAKGKEQSSFYNPAILCPALGHTICTTAEAIQSVTVSTVEGATHRGAKAYRERTAAVSRQKMALGDERSCSGVWISQFGICPAREYVCNPQRKTTLRKQPHDRPRPL